MDLSLTQKYLLLLKILHVRMTTFRINKFLAPAADVEHAKVYFKELVVALFRLTTAVALIVRHI